MRGSYQMVAEDGTPLRAPIPEFTLSIRACCTDHFGFPRPVNQR